MSYGNPVYPKICQACGGSSLALVKAAGNISFICLVQGCGATYAWPPSPSEQALPWVTDEAEPGLKVPDIRNVVEALIESYTGGSWVEMVERLERKHKLVIRRLP